MVHSIYLCRRMQVHIYWDYKGRLCIRMQLPFWLSFCEPLPWYFRLCTYAFVCTSLHLKFCVCMCLSTPTSLCLSTYGFLYVPAATAFSKGHKPLPEMGHFLLADKLWALSLQGVCKYTVGVLLVCVEFVLLSMDIY